MNEIIKGEKTIKLINFIEEIIKNTSLDGKVYLAGETVREWFRGNEDKNIEIIVKHPGGASTLAKMLTTECHSYVSGENPVHLSYNDFIDFNLKNNKDFADFNFMAYDSMRITHVLSNLLKDDAEKRNVTVNALYYNITTDTFEDPTGNGINDIKNKIIRCVKPCQFFVENPANVIKLIRLSCDFGFGIEKNTWMSMLTYSNNILKATQTQITLELLKLLMTEKPSVGLRKMAVCNHLLNDVLPIIHDEMYAMEDRNTTLFDHTMDVVDKVEPSIRNRLAALFHDIGKVNNGVQSHASEGAKTAKGILTAMSVPNSIINSVCIAITVHEVFSTYSDKEIPRKSLLRSFSSFIGNDLYLAMDLIDANNNSKQFGAKPNQAKNILAKIESLRNKEKKEKENNPKLPINGNDIIESFSIKTGPMVGRILSNLKKKYAKNPTMTKEDCLDYVNDLIKAKTK